MWAEVKEDFQPTISNLLLSFIRQKTEVKCTPGVLSSLSQLMNINGCTKGEKIVVNILYLKRFASFGDTSRK